LAVFGRLWRRHPVLSHPPSVHALAFVVVFDSLEWVSKERKKEKERK
jgi:hypothetical protein